MRTALIFIALLFSAAQGFAQGQPVKEWTFMVFMNADNNLYDFGKKNLEQMQTIGSNNAMNIVVEMDPEPSGLPTQRLLVQKGGSDVIETLGETNMGDWKHLAEFVTWTMTKFPAKHYALVIWNHGAGWEGVSYDDNPRANMSVPEVAQALRASKAFAARSGMRDPRAPLIDILNFDACLMSGIETAYEMKDVAGIMIGSQYNEPGEGEDYSAVLGLLAENPTAEPRKLAEHMVFQYVSQYPDQNEINYLAVDLSKIAGFTQFFKAAAAEHLKVDNGTARRLHQAYDSVDGGDLIGGLTGARAVAQKGTVLADAIDKVINAYGYPSEGKQDFVRGPQEWGGRALKVIRSFPANVWYRMSPNGKWQQAALQPMADGNYGVSMPWPAQYAVQRTAEGGSEAVAPAEAVSTFIQKARGTPIVFHNNFPATSPVIAEAHNVDTEGSTGLSLYHSSAKMLERRGARALAAKVNSDYMKLQFAINGAPEWTQFIGFSQRQSSSLLAQEKTSPAFFGLGPIR